MNNKRTAPKKKALIDLMKGERAVDVFFFMVNYRYLVASHENLTRVARLNIEDRVALTRMKEGLLTVIRKEKTYFRWRGLG